LINGILLTQYNGKILGPVAKLLGIILNWIFVFLNMIGIPNIGLAIIIFTFIIYLCLLPLTIKQQKFSKLSALMNPELNQIREKYKNKTDQVSMQRQNEEMQLVYKKYGVSPTGSCVQLLIQMPILFALYRVIYNIPAYVSIVKDSLMGLAVEIVDTAGGSEFVASLKTAVQYFAKSDYSLPDTIIDVLNRASSDEWDSIINKFPDLVNFDSARMLFERYNNFLGLNISDSPAFIVRNAFADRNFILIIGALIIPVLSAVTQWVNYLFMPQPQNQSTADNPMAQSMKTMNVMMPIMSAVFCYTLPCGMGIYWIAGAVIRSVEQVIINKQIDKMDYDKILEKNREKYEKQKSKIKEQSSKSISALASTSTKGVAGIAGKNVSDRNINYNNNPKAGSLAAKANKVREYNEKNKK